MSHGDDVQKAARGLRRGGGHRDQPHRRHRELGAPALRHAVPPRGRAHAEEGAAVLGNFLRVCGCAGRLERGLVRRGGHESIREQVGDRGKVDLRPVRRGGLRGGRGAGSPGHRRPAARASSWTTGCSARSEAKQVRRALRRAARTSRSCSSTPPKRSSTKLAGVADPERKRKIIGADVHRGLRVDRGAGSGKRRLPGPGHAVPRRDRVASRFGGPSAVIKSHHNVGGLPEVDEVRARRAAALSCSRTRSARSGRRARARRRVRPPAALSRPGPRGALLGAVTTERLDVLRAGGPHLHRGDQARRALPQDLAVLRRPAAGPLGGGHGRRPHLRVRDRAAGGGVPGRDDRGLGRAALRPARRGSRTGSSTRCPGSTASSTTSAPSRRPRSSGNDFAYARVSDFSLQCELSR